ncbi:MAG: hypothetical protein ACK450_04345 [Sphingomonadales bacterium]
MKLNKEALIWLRENKGRLNDASRSSQRQRKDKASAQRQRSNSAKQATNLHAKYVRHQFAQNIMTFSEFRDQTKRDAICRQYGLDLIRL